MVEEVRRAEGSLREIAARFGVHHATLLRWVRRAEGCRLDRVAWSDLPSGPRDGVGRIDPAMEEQILSIRRWLREASALGEFGARAIRDELVARGLSDLPSVRTIGRVLERRGALDARGRVRRPAPPRGWYLSGLAERRVELDSFDVITDLKIEEGPWIEVFTGISLHGGAVSAWPAQHVLGADVRAWLEAHWRATGCPDYVQFDNDTRFAGARLREAEVGRVARFCLSLGIALVFAPPRERGFQSEIERFNGLWQAKVWRRFRHRDLEALRARSESYIAASHWRHAARIESAPPRRPFPLDWSFDVKAPPTGRLILIRRTSDQGVVDLLQRRMPVGASWPQRLVRCEIDFSSQSVSIFGLRRAAPHDHALLAQLPYPLVTRRYSARRRGRQ